MASVNAEAVAKDVIKTVRSGKIVNFQELQKKNGYSDNSCKSMKAKRTKTFQTAINPLVERLQNEIDRIQIEMSNRKITDEKYIELAKVMDIYIKNSQLLSGKNTEKVGVSDVSESEVIDIIKRYATRRENSSIEKDIL